MGNESLLRENQIKDDLNVLESLFSLERRRLSTQSESYLLIDTLYRMTREVKFNLRHQRKHDSEAYFNYLRDATTLLDNCIMEGMSDADPDARAMLTQCANSLNIFKIAYLKQELKPKSWLQYLSGEQQQLSGEKGEMVSDLGRVLDQKPPSQYKKSTLDIFSFSQKARKKHITEYKRIFSDLWMEHHRLMYLRQIRKRQLDKRQCERETFSAVMLLINHAENPDMMKTSVPHHELYLLGEVIGQTLLRKLADRYQIDLNNGLTHKKLRMLLIGVSTHYTQQDNICLKQNDRILSRLLHMKNSPHLKINKALLGKNTEFDKDLNFMSRKIESRYQKALPNGYPTPQKIRKRSNDVVDDMLRILIKKSRTASNKHRSIDRQVTEAIAEIEKTYPGLKKVHFLESADPNDKLLLRHYIKSLAKLMKQKGSAEDIEHVREKLFDFVYHQCEKRQDFARAEFIGHELAYGDLYSRDGHILKLPNAQHEWVDFEMKGVIRDEEGLGMALFSQAGHILEQQSTIPILITFAGTHDGDSALRDLDPNGPGAAEFNPSSPYFKRMITAINAKIGEIKKNYPDKKVTIEIFGHSLGSSDTYHLSLAILQAMSQNAYHEGTYDVTRGMLSEFDQSQKTDCANALDTVLGFKERKLAHGIAHHTNLSDIPGIEKDKWLAYDQLTLSNIASVSLNTNNASGIHDQISYSMHAAAAYLGKVDPLRNTPNAFTINSISNTTNRDLVQKTWHTRDLAYAVPQVNLFDHVHVHTCRHYTTSAEELYHLFFKGRVLKLEAHRHFTLNNVKTWLGIDEKIISNDNAIHQKHQQSIFNKTLKILGRQLFHTQGIPEGMSLVQESLKSLRTLSYLPSQAKSTISKSLFPDVPENAPPLIHTKEHYHKKIHPKLKPRGDHRNH